MFHYTWVSMIIFTIFFPFEVNRSKRKKGKIELLQNTKNQKVDFYICFKVPIGPTDHAKKVCKNLGYMDFLSS